MRDLVGKRALVTGAASGIGLGIARALARAGTHVVLADIERGRLAEAARSVADLGVDSRPLLLDVTDREAMRHAASDMREAGDELHIVVNNAGVGYHACPIHEAPDAAFDWVFDVNVAGVFNGIKAFVPLLREHGKGGHVVNTGSMGGFIVSSDATLHAGLYSASKFAVTAMTEALRNALAPDDIGVSLLAPAFVDTDFAHSSRNRPGGPAPEDLNMDFGARLSQGMPPDQVGERVVAGIRGNLPYIFTHPAGRALIEARNERLIAGFDATANF